MEYLNWKKTLSENACGKIRFILPTGTKAPPHGRG
jgi:hypothetical protein